MKKITFTLLLLVVSVYMASQTVLSGTRDMWKWPFADNSIWNMPIGSGATYQPANLLAEYAIGYNLVQLLEMKSEYPIVNVRNNTGGNTPCDGTTSLGFTLQIPSDWVVPNTPGFAFRTPSSNEVMQGAQVARCIVEGPVYLPDYMQWENNRTLQPLTGSGLDGGGHGASLMSTLGGTIRLGELTNEEPIRHALKIKLHVVKYLSPDGSGFRWPAKTASWNASSYQGTNPNLVMGSLLAIPPSIMPESLGLTTEAGKKIFFALQNYGAYIVEDTGWDAYDIVIENGVEAEVMAKYGFNMYSEPGMENFDPTWKEEFNKLMVALNIVTNNTSTTIGGGGTPLQPLAPEFGTSTATNIAQSNKNVISYPNPLIGNTLNFSSIVSGEIYTLQGSLVVSFHNTDKVNIQLNSGAYLLKINDGTNTISEKLIKF